MSTAARVDTGRRPSRRCRRRLSAARPGVGQLDRRATAAVSLAAMASAWAGLSRSSQRMPKALSARRARVSVRRSSPRSRTARPPPVRRRPRRVQLADLRGQVQIEPDDRRRPAGALAAEQGEGQPVQHQGSIGQPGELIVQRGLPDVVESVWRILPGARVDQLGGDHVGHGLGGTHHLEGQWSSDVLVQVERTEPVVRVPQREGEHRTKAGAQRPGTEGGETLVAAEIRRRDRAHRTWPPARPAPRPASAAAARTPVRRRRTQPRTGARRPAAAVSRRHC